MSTTTPSNAVFFSELSSRAAVDNTDILAIESSSGILDKVTLEVLIDFIIPVGMVFEWNLDDDPATYGVPFLPLNGQGVLVASYPELTANCAVSAASNAAVASAGGGFYRANNSDGSAPNSAGAYLILPESRGVVARGLDSAASIDPDGASRYLGDLQQDSFQGFEMGGAKIGGGADLYMAGTDTAGGGNYAFRTAVTGALLRMQSFHDNGVHGTPRVDSESRAYNRSTQFVIRY